MHVFCLYNMGQNWVKDIASRISIITLYQQIPGIHKEQDFLKLYLRLSGYIGKVSLSKITKLNCTTSDG